MSLIITSSSQGTGETNQIGIARPQQYKNYMQNSLIVPPNSEIAVESIKINRNPMIDLGSGVVTNFWFGERLTSTATFQKSLSYHIPTKNSVGKSISPVDFTDDYVNILKSGYSFHPEIDSQNIVVSVSTTTTGAFTGFNFVIPQVAASATSVIPPATTSLVLIPTSDEPIAGADDPTWDGSEIDGTTGQFCQLQPRGTEGGPISLYNGLLAYDVSGQTQFTVGLARPYCRKNMTAEIQSPTEVFRGDIRGIGKEGFDFYDYAAQVGDDGKLRLYHSILPPRRTTEFDAAGGSRLMMSEIRYYQKNNSSFAAGNGTNSSFATGSPITWSGNEDTISFETIGEKVRITLGAALVVEPILVNASTKGQVPKPIGQTAWKMYPTVSFWEDDNPIPIDDYNCRTSSTIWNNQPENSWITRTLTAVNLPDDGTSLLSPDYALLNTITDEKWNNAVEWGRELDSRQVYRPYEALDPSPSVPTSGGDIRVYRGLTNKIITDYQNIFIMGKTDRYFKASKLAEWQANSALALGFQGYSINPSSGMSSSGTFGSFFTSAQRPSLSSLHSAFIRVPTFTHETYNFGTGNPSKILFQVPRFDNSGADIGALYYQNNDKTYVDLHNTTDLRITDLDIHIVRKDETFVEDLTGSTEIVFHIRKIK